MMQVKKYRGSTTREALEKIKQDLGENAFVLETKRVQTKGFLGFGAETQIEISAAASGENALKKETPVKKEKNSPLTTLSLSFTDNTPAIPKVSEKQTEIKNDFGKEQLLQALKLRAASANEFDNEVAVLTKASSFQPKPIERVEIATTAPQVVHRRKMVSKPVFADSPATPTINTLKTPTTPTLKINENETTSQNTNSRELELLRAELREVKFSISAFVNRQNTLPWQNGIDLEMFDEIFESPFYEAYLDLSATGISNELAHKVIADIVPLYKKGLVRTEFLAQTALLKSLASYVKFDSNPLQEGKPSILAVIGATGVGKTTTIAKLAARIALHEKRRVELVTLDTYRIAAVEQLKTYAEIIGAGCSVVRSVLELDAVLRRFSSDATVLIDTTGKNPHDLADQYELAEYLRASDEIRKCLTIQATTNSHDGIATIKKFEMYGADCLAITKLDETTQPGAMVELAAQSNLPLVYLCSGQRVPEDLQTATPDAFVNGIFRANLHK